jgi:hypothetical protein
VAVVNNLERRGGNEIRRAQREWNEMEMKAVSLFIRREVSSEKC